MILLIQHPSLARWHGRNNRYPFIVRYDKWNNNNDIADEAVVERVPHMVDTVCNCIIT